MASGSAVCLQPSLRRCCGPSLAWSLAAAAAAIMVAWLRGWCGARADLRLFTPEELARYRGGPGDPGLYLAFLGRVYDVSSGRRHYEPGAHYSGFAGTVIGRFYGEDGLPTPQLAQVEAMMTKALEANKQEQKEKQKFPPCNAEWSATKGSRFWCSPKSGGVSRDWIGVPRKLYKPGAKEPLCVCVRATGPPSDQLDNPVHTNRGDLDDPSLREYTGCPPLAITCSFPL
ncbi:neuferricin isoform X2 [Dipodomys spectabilis]|uniref:neuferricin isoform X2 n=1 Tax=Dipodomys spectabilis TaxID=105255 RepID=UPI001C542EE2|nr:neuferricin isoform X2 [Dipodomys spectabilis]